MTGTNEYMRPADIDASVGGKLYRTAGLVVNPELVPGAPGPRSRGILAWGRTGSGSWA